MEIGKKIYYEVQSGVILVDKGEMSGDVRETTETEDREIYPILQLYDGRYNVKQLQYGEMAAEFKTCKAYKINTATEEVEFLF